MSRLGRIAGRRDIESGNPTARVRSTAAAQHFGSADTLIGRATVIDSETIEIHSQRLRPLDIDAPESQKMCSRVGGDQATVDWPCGHGPPWRFPTA